MGTIIRLLLARVLSARVAVLVAAFVLGRVMAGRRERAADTGSGHRVS